MTTCAIWASSRPPGQARERAHRCYSDGNAAGLRHADFLSRPINDASRTPLAQPAAPDELIERCLRGDQLAWETIVRQHWRKVFNVAYKFVGKHDEAEDLTQDIFLKIFRSLHTFDRRANFQTWLISVSRNLCIDHYRSVRKERETINRDVDPGELSPSVARCERVCRPRAAAIASCCCERPCSSCPTRCGRR